MKKEMRSRMLLIFISLMLMMVFIPTASATVYSTEDFEDETAGTNPSSDWYTYSDSGFDISDVTTNSSRTGTQGFHIYDGAGSDNANALFAIDTVTYYDFFRFYINVSKAQHDQINISFNDSSGRELARIDLTTDNLYFNNTSPIYSVTIGNDMWYRIDIDFNLTDDTIGILVYNMSDSGASLGSGWGVMGNGAGTYTDVANIKFWGTNDGRTTWVCIDDLTLAYTYINPAQASIDAVVAAISALFAVAILLQVVAIMSSEINPYSLIMLLVTIIIGVITLSIVAGL